MVELTTPSIVVDVLPLNCSVDEQIVPEPLTFELLFRTLLPLLQLDEVVDELLDEESPEADRTLTNQIIEPINNKIIVKPIEPIIAGAKSD